MKLLRRQFLHLAAGAATLPAGSRIAISKNTMGRLAVFLAALLCGGMQEIYTAAAQEWPTRPVTMIVTYPAGGTGDTLGRILAAGLSNVLGQQVIVENIGGAGGETGIARVVKAAPDGYHFALGDVGPSALSQTLHKKMPYDSNADLTPVALIATIPNVLISRRDLPVTNLQEFAA